MALDSVRSLKLECPSELGSQLDPVPTEVDSTQDALSAAGLFVNGPTVTSADKAVLIDRAPGGSLRLTDTATSKVLAELVTSALGKPGTHDGLRDLAHFLSGQGPATGFASGATCQRTFSGPLIASETWYTSSGMTTKIAARTYTYPSGSPTPSAITHTVYDASGGLLHQIVDTLSYNGPICVGSSRTWS